MLYIFYTGKYDYYREEFYSSLSCNGSSTLREYNDCDGFGYNTSCYCGNEDGTILATTNDCYTVSAQTLISCTTTYTEILLIDSCYYVDDSYDSYGYPIYQHLTCDNDIIGIEYYYDSICESLDPDPINWLNDNCTQDIEYKCDYNTVDDDSECGHWNNYPMDRCIIKYETSG